jgi:CRISPR-associated protein Cas5t
MLRLRVQAPFAAFRTFAAGGFRPSAPFLTYSAAYGLLLNLAGREMRAHDDGKSVMTTIATGLPKLELALGVPAALPVEQSLYQQLHNYPVGTSGKDRQQSAFGNKYNITPARRVVLHRLDVLIVLRGDADLEANIVTGLQGGGRSYGLPFLGDNNFLPDRIDPADESTEARWLVPIEEGAAMDDLPGQAMRLTVTIDRSDMSQTHSGLFQVAVAATGTPPDSAWVAVGY